MRKVYSILVFLAVSPLLTACGSSEDVNPPNAPAPAAANWSASAFVDEVIQEQGLPKLGEKVKFTWPKFHYLPQDIECVYHEDISIEVASVTETGISFKSNSGTTPFKDNSAACPSVIPNRRSNRSFDYTREEYIQLKKKAYELEFIPSLLCKEISWCISASLTRIDEVTYKGIRSVYIESQIQSKSGKTYKKTSWISRESLLQGNFEYDISTTDTNSWIDYKTLLNF